MPINNQFTEQFTYQFTGDDGSVQERTMNTQPLAIAFFNPQDETIPLPFVITDGAAGATPQITAITHEAPVTYSNDQQTGGKRLFRMEFAAYFDNTTRRDEMIAAAQSILAAETPSFVTGVTLDGSFIYAEGVFQFTTSATLEGNTADRIIAQMAGAFPYYTGNLEDREHNSVDGYFSPRAAIVSDILRSRTDGYIFTGATNARRWNDMTITTRTNTNLNPNGTTGNRLDFVVSGTPNIAIAWDAVFLPKAIWDAGRRTGRQLIMRVVNDFGNSANGTFTVTYQNAAGGTISTETFDPVDANGGTQITVPANTAFIVLSFTNTNQSNGTYYMFRPQLYFA